jgi:predicted ATPase
VSVLIGRDQELSILEEALSAARGGTACCIFLTGEAGIGKSHLIEELRRQAALEKFSIFQGNCFEQSISFPYAPWIDALRGAFAPLGTTEIEELLGPLAPEFMKLLPELALLIPQIQPSTSLDPLAEKYRLFETFARLGSSLSASNPVLFILEDLHWGDALSLELVQYFIRRVHNQSFMFVGTCRSEEFSPQLSHLLSELNRERLVQEIALKPLSRDEIEQLTRALLKTQRGIPARFVDTFLTLTDGNPFFVEETLKKLTEEGPIDELLQQKTLDALDVPHSIQRMVQQRVEQLPEATRRILICASVIGQRFNFGLLQETTAQNEPELLQALKESIDSHLVVQESADQFAFKHALTRNAVYSMLMLREQKAMHQTVGKIFEQLYGKISDSHASELAYHFYQAEAWQKALKYAQRAGELAQALYAPYEAMTFFTQAIQAAQRLNIEAALTILRNRAHAFELLGEFDSALSDYETALKSAAHMDDRSSECAILLDLGFLWQSRDWKLAGDYFQAAVDEIASPGLVLHFLLPGTPAGPESMKRHIESTRAAFPDVRITIEDQVATEDKVVVRWTMTGTHRGPYASTATINGLSLTSAILGMFGAVVVGWLTTREHVFPAWVGWVFIVQGLLNFITGLFNMGAQGRLFPILVPILQTVATFAYGYFIYQIQ